MRNLNKIFLLFIFVALTAVAFGQTTVSGIVTGEDGKGIPGVTIMVKGTTVGTVTDINGKYTITAAEGTEFLVYSYIGMETKEVAISGGTLNVQLAVESAEIAEIYVIADRAKERETPVAFSDITKEEVEQQLGSRDIPLVLNMTPSVYATAGGGGAGDARINLRGFDQRNIAIMINGVPMNDMENGWVYWSNWDGVGDAVSSIQVQRGLSAVNIATASVGGTMNIITSPADKKAGGSAKFEYGSGNFMKATLSGHSGLINDQFAISAVVVGKQGVGIMDQTWTQAAAYYLGASFKASDDHKFEFFAMGAPQRHGQNLYKQNIAAYGSDIAADFGADQTTIDAFPESVADDSYPGFDGAQGGRYYNENWGPVSSSYTGQQWFNGKLHDRYSSDFLNERENYFHKPLTNLNWYATWSDKVKQYTTLYYSGGKGGGTGTYGSVAWNYHEGLPSPSRFVNYDLTVDNNTATDTAYGILRNSVNNQWTVGALSRAKIMFSDNFKAQIGVDWRTAKIFHFREVRDLLGGQFFYYDGNEFESGTEYNKVLGDKIAYNFTNTVDWMGYFAQAEYATDKITAYATFAHSFVKYTYTNHFRMADDGSELAAEVGYIPGYQIKGGLSYRPMDGLNVFANYGYVSKIPIFDAVIDDYNATIAEDPQNEIFNSIEAGVGYQTPTKNLTVNANYYYTIWSNRTISFPVLIDVDQDGIVFVTGMDALHSGFEFEAFYSPIKYVEIGAVTSFGNWTYTKDVDGEYRYYDDVDGSFQTGEVKLALDGLKVGDMPQTQIAGMLVIKPINDLRFQFDARYYTNHYSFFEPFSRDFVDEADADRDQVWLTPAYFLADMHVSYKLPLKGKFGIEIFGHVFNLLDELYIQDAVDNSAYNGNYTGSGATTFNHDINTAELYLGLPRRFNAGVRFTF